MSGRSAPATYWIALAAGAFILIGSLAPWATALGGLVKVNGTDGDGAITLILALVAMAGLVYYQRNPSRRVALAVVVLIGLATLGIGIYDLVNIENIVSGSSGLVSAGWGLWLVVVASAALSVATIAFGRELANRPGTNQG